MYYNSDGFTKNVFERSVMNDKIKVKYANKSITYVNMRMYFIKIAIQLINDCKYGL